MLSDLLVTAVFLTVAVAGLTRPYIALAGVIWVETVRPQELSFGFLRVLPLSLWAGLLLAGSFLVGFKNWRWPVRMTYPFLILLFMFWVTLSTYNAAFQDVAWPKHDVVIKTLLIALLVPFAINTRNKIECAIWAYVASVGFFCIQGGMKTLLAGGGYGDDLLVQAAGGLITESSTLAAVSVATMPLLFYLARWSLMAAWFPPLRIVLYLTLLACGLTFIGTFARTGLVCAGAYLLLFLWESKRKVQHLFAAGLLLASVSYFVNDEWLDRMETLNAVGQDSSASGRIVVWRWTIDYVSTRPLLGGGFEAYLANAGRLFDYARSDESLAVDRTTEQGKAFHSIVFQVLGEHGYGGLLIFLAVIVSALRSNQRRRRYELGDWADGLAMALSQSLIVFCVGGLFIGVAYIPVIWFLTAFSISLGNITNLAPAPAPRVVTAGGVHLPSRRRAVGA